MTKTGVVIEESCFLSSCRGSDCAWEYIETGPYHLQARDKLEFQTCSYLQVMGCLAYNCRFTQIWFVLFVGVGVRCGSISVIMVFSVWLCVEYQEQEGECTI